MAAGQKPASVQVWTLFCLLFTGNRSTDFDGKFVYTYVKRLQAIWNWQYTFCEKDGGGAWREERQQGWSFVAV